MQLLLLPLLPLQLPQTGNAAPCSSLPQARFEQDEERALFKAYQQAAAQVRACGAGSIARGLKMWWHGRAAVAAAKRPLAQRRTTATDALTPSRPPQHLSYLCPSSHPVLPPAPVSQIAPGMSVPAFLAATEPLIAPLDAFFDKVFVMCEDEVSFGVCVVSFSRCCEGNAKGERDGWQWTPPVGQGATRLG